MDKMVLLMVRSGDNGEGGKSLPVCLAGSGICVYICTCPYIYIGECTPNLWGKNQPITRQQLTAGFYIPVYVLHSQAYIQGLLLISLSKLVMGKYLDLYPPVTDQPVLIHVIIFYHPA